MAALEVELSRAHERIQNLAADLARARRVVLVGILRVCACVCVCLYVCQVGAAPAFVACGGQRILV